MSRSKVGPVMALFTGAVLVGGATMAAAEEPSATPIVLDAVALDSVTAGSFQVGASVFGSAGAQGGDGATATVGFSADGRADPSGGLARGFIRASGFGLSSSELPADSFAQTDGDAAGNIVAFVRTFNHNNSGARFSLSESVTVSFGYSLAPIVLPAKPTL